MPSITLEVYKLFQMFAVIFVSVKLAPCPEEKTSLPLITNALAYTDPLA